MSIISKYISKVSDQQFHFLISENTSDKQDKHKEAMDDGSSTNGTYVCTYTSDRLYV